MKTTNKNGFTLIEIIIVLAIGALIVLIAFIGVPMAKRMIRDNQRKSDLENTAIAFKAFQSAHNGCLPTWLDNGTIGPPMYPPRRPELPPFPADCENSYLFGAAMAGISPMLDASKLIAGGYYHPNTYGIDPLARQRYQWHEIGPDYGMGMKPATMHPNCTDADSKPTESTPARIKYYREVDYRTVTLGIDRSQIPHRFALGICLEAGEEFIQEFDF